MLAAGFGRRLAPLTDVLPKAMCPVANVPLVDLAVERVRTCTTDVAVNVHHHRERMEAHLEGLGDVKVSVEEREPLGTAGALGLLRDWIDNRAALVHNADAWHDADIADVLLKEWDRERIRLLVVRARPGMEDFDGWTFAGVSLLPWADVRALRPEPSGLWEVSWRQAWDEGRVEVVAHDGRWFDTGTPSRYLAANLAASNGASVIAPDAVVEGEVIRSVVWSGATVGADEHLTEKIRAPGPLTVDARLTTDLAW